ncbi:jg13 [Pararge aegeria aegeria]|uniref:Jg13 protein n=1 Tax=Pararge aegeria aegeria TaxID=348720 RepID=A0A8S4QY79_9NEOP|nr:jg13 [Pararge aegeria aegeria]
MNSAMLPVTATATRTVLALEGFLFSINEVVCMEMEILKALEFRVPLMTSVEVGEMLAHELAVQPQVLPAVTKLIDMAELCRYDVEKVVRWVARSRGLSNYEEVRCFMLKSGDLDIQQRTKLVCSVRSLPYFAKSPSGNPC